MRQGSGAACGGSKAWLASTDDAVVAVDTEGRVVLHNPVASRVAAARALGIGRATFSRWWREAGLGA